MSISPSLCAGLLYRSLNYRIHFIYLLDYYYKDDYYLAFSDKIERFVNASSTYLCNENLYKYVQIKSESLDEYSNISSLLID